MRRFVKNDIENSKNLLDNLKKIIELRLQNIMNAENLRGLSMEHGVVLNIKKRGGYRIIALRTRSVFSFPETVYFAISSRTLMETVVIAIRLPFTLSYLPVPGFL